MQLFDAEGSRLYLTEEERRAFLVTAQPTPTILLAVGFPDPAVDAEAAGLFRGMTAYTGRFRVEGNRVVTDLDVAWRPSWEGSEQEPFCSLEGDRLILRTGVMGHSSRPGCRHRATFTWTRD